MEVEPYCPVDVWPTFRKNVLHLLKMETTPYNLVYSYPRFGGMCWQNSRWIKGIPPKYRYIGKRRQRSMSHKLTILKQQYVGEN